MRVVEVSRAGGPEVLQVVERPEPQAGPGEVVVRIHAATVNPTDLGARQGHVRGEVTGPPYVLGWDLAGEVTASEDPAFAAGDAVVGMIHWYGQGGRLGAYAESVAVPGSWLTPKPAGLSDPDAASVPLNALTAAQCFDLLAVPPGEPLLVTGASGAVGSFAVQLAATAGHPVTALAGRDDEDWVASLGATTVLPRDTDMRTAGRFRWVLDAVPLGASVFEAVDDGGLVVTVRAPAQVPEGRDVRTRGMLIEQDTPRLAGLLADVAAGRLLTRVAQTLPLEQAARAHELNERGGLHGKVVLVS